VPSGINYVPYSFDAIYRGEFITRNNWMNTEVGRARVFGEFLRIVYLGGIGHVLALEEMVEGLEDYIALNLNKL
jgi:hypothetical protein